MTAYTQRQHLNYTVSQLFDLVADVERYPEFMPWVVDAHIQHREGHTIVGEMTVAAGPLRKRFSTVGVLDRPHRIEVSNRDPMFDRFAQQWIFEPVTGGGTNIEYHVDLKFRSSVLQLLMGASFADRGRLRRCQPSKIGRIGFTAVNRQRDLAKFDAHQFCRAMTTRPIHTSLACGLLMHAGDMAQLAQRPDGIASGLSRGWAPKPIKRIRHDAIAGRGEPDHGATHEKCEQRPAGTKRKHNDRRDGNVDADRKIDPAIEIPAMLLR